VTLIVRAAIAADRPALGRLGALLVRAHHEFDRTRFMPASSGTEQGYASYLASQLGRPDVILLVAEQEGRVVGYSYAGIEGRDYMSLRGPAAVLHDLVVDPEHRGRGVGGRLLDETLRAIEARGVPQIVLFTAAPNEPAKRLFARAGFRQTMVEMTRDLD
jgi:ribosomal protein S18 acetylase RimI-like enzyme